MRQSSDRVIVIGAGVGGLVSAALLARRGHEVIVLERGRQVGGKMRTVDVAGRPIDAGPTVLTMRWVFDELYNDLGTTLENHLRLVPAELLARHAWHDAEATLDLFADIDRSADAIGTFAGRTEAEGYRRFCAYAQRIYETIERPFFRAESSGQSASLNLTRGIGLGALLHIDAHRTLWKALGDFFHDPRLRQLFGRHATSFGSSPFLAPATLNVIAHIEREGVFLVEGGMVTVARSLARLAERAGATLHCDVEVQEIVVEDGRATGVLLASGERINADAVVLNGDTEALARGLFGPRAAGATSPAAARSLSAITWAMVAETSGFPLVRHNVFFSSDYATEFRELISLGRLPAEPTVHVCAQDRDELGAMDDRGPERLLIRIDAPPNGDKKPLESHELRACEVRSFDLLRRSGLAVRCSAASPVVTTPSDFERLFPGTGGALYGPAFHGMTSPFSRASSRTKLPGLYLAGASVHPGAGVSMVALSGRLAAESVSEDIVVTSRSQMATLRSPGQRISSPGA